MCACVSVSVVFVGGFGQTVSSRLISLFLQSSLIDLKEHASSLASSGLKKDSKLKSLEIAIEQKKEECSKLETQLQKVRFFFWHLDNTILDFLGL